MDGPPRFFKLPTPRNGELAQIEEEEETESSDDYDPKEFEVYGIKLPERQ